MLPRHIKKHRTQCAQRTQSGNALILALLALILLGAITLAKVQADIAEDKRAQGQSEASVLEVLKTAVNQAIFDNLVEMQQGQPMRPAGTLSSAAAGGVQVAPTVLAGNQAQWQPSVQELRALGYLPASFNASSVAANGGQYRIQIRREPAGCETLANSFNGSSCKLEGMLVLDQPITDRNSPGNQMDAVVVGTILKKLGADGGASLHPSLMAVVDQDAVTGTITDRRGFIAGFNSMWFQANPVPGSPAGVVGVKVGGDSQGFAQFVRINDTRDINFRGALTVVGVLNAASGVQVGSVPGTPSGTSNPCVDISPSGQIDIKCTGQLNAAQGRFTQLDATGNVLGITEIDLRGLVTNQALSASSAAGTSTLAPGAISTTGQVSAARVVAQAGVKAQTLSLSDVQEGTACPAAAGTGTQYGGLNGGGLAMCAGGQWLAINRFRSAGSVCGPGEGEGTSATDIGDKQTLICRGGVYQRLGALQTNFVLVRTDQLVFTAAGGPLRVNKPSCQDPRAGQTNAATAPQALIVLTAQSEASATDAVSLSGVNRFAVDNGDGTWTAHLERSFDNATVAGVSVAMVYCLYP
jgi:hypothetical protein